MNGRKITYCTFSLPLIVWIFDYEGKKHWKKKQVKWISYGGHGHKFPPTDTSAICAQAELHSSSELSSATVAAPAVCYSWICSSTDLKEEVTLGLIPLKLDNGTLFVWSMFEGLFLGHLNNRHFETALMRSSNVKHEKWKLAINALKSKLWTGHI